MALFVIGSPLTAKIETPCVDICRIDPGTRLCLGCLRSLDEIAAWGGLTHSERRRIMESLPRRGNRGPVSSAT